MPSPLIYAKRIPGKGLGVFAAVELARDQEIERAPVVVLPVAEARLLAKHSGVLGRYAFSWGRETVALALGFGSLYNHASDPNAYCEDRGPRTKVFFARRRIGLGFRPFLGSPRLFCAFLGALCSSKGDSPCLHRPKRPETRSPAR